MFFLKKKIGLESFIRMIANEVLKVPQYTYDDYLEIDPNALLSRKEFEEFNSNVSLLRVLLLYAMLIDNKDRRQIKDSMKELDKTFNQALELSYQDHDFDQDEAQRLTEVVSSELDLLISYTASIPEKDILVKGFTPFTCLYYTARYVETSEESVRTGVYVALINNQRELMKEYFKKAIAKVKIEN